MPAVMGNTDRDLVVDDEDLPQSLLQFRENRTAANFKNLLSTFLRNTHGPTTDGFDDISSAAAVLSTIPGRQKELEDVAAFLCDLLEADLDPGLDPRLSIAHYPLAFYRNVCLGVTEALGLSHQTTIKVLMLRIFQAPEHVPLWSDESTRKTLIEEFLKLLGQAGLDLSHMTGVFDGQIRPHQTGTFVDDNVSDDPLRRARYYYAISRVLVALGEVGLALGFSAPAYLTSALSWVDLSHKTLANLSNQPHFWERRGPEALAKLEVQLHRRRTAELGAKLQTRVLLGPDPQYHTPGEVSETPPWDAPEEDE